MNCTGCVQCCVYLHVNVHCSPASCVVCIRRRAHGGPCVAGVVCPIYTITGCASIASQSCIMYGYFVAAGSLLCVTCLVVALCACADADSSSQHVPSSGSNDSSKVVDALKESLFEAIVSKRLHQEQMASRAVPHMQPPQPTASLPELGIMRDAEDAVDAAVITDGFQLSSALSVHQELVCLAQAVCAVAPPTLTAKHARERMAIPERKLNAVLWKLRKRAGLVK